MKILRTNAWIQFKSLIYIPMEGLCSAETLCQTSFTPPTVNLHVFIGLILIGQVQKHLYRLIGHLHLTLVNKATYGV